MDKRLQSIYRAFNGKLVGKERMKRAVCRVLSRMPQEIIETITSSTWFMGSFDDAWAFTFTGNDLVNQHLVFLSDDLFMQDDQQIEYTIAHEIGHIILRHRNSVLERQSREEVEKQEQEADAFAKKYIFS